MRLFYFTPSRWGLDNLRKRRLKISLIDELNDPFELMAGDMRSKADRALFNSWRSELCKRHGVLCFSDGWHDPLLWSHYADRHRGTCLEFDSGKAEVSEVKYQAGRLPDLIPSLLRGSRDDQEKATALLYKTKYVRWRYEAEHRLFTSLDPSSAEEGKYFFDFDGGLTVKNVYLGPRFDGNRSQMEGVLRAGYQGVELIETRLAFKTYSVVRQKAKVRWIA